MKIHIRKYAAKQGIAEEEALKKGDGSQGEGVRGKPPGLMEDRREFIYRVDAQNRIRSANEDWFIFARENGVANLDSAAVIGQEIWGFLCNSETKNLFEVLMQKVRETGVSAVLPFRCDAPDRRRFMELKIELGQHQELEFRSRILRQELRASVRLMEADVEHTDELLIMCAWCKQVQLPDERWVEVEDAVKALNLFDSPRLPGISHGICKACASVFKQALIRVQARPSADNFR